MQEVSIVERRNRFSSLIEQAESGEEILVTRHGRGVAKIVCFDSEKAGRATAKVFDQIRQNAKSMQLGSFDLSQFREERDGGRH
jgi:prevent-host-death family protein